MRQIHRAKHEAIDGAEHHRVRADGDGERDDRRAGEARCFTQLPNAEANVPDECFHNTAVIHRESGSAARVPGTNWVSRPKPSATMPHSTAWAAGSTNLSTGRFLESAQVSSSGRE